MSLVNELVVLVVFLCGLSSYLWLKIKRLESTEDVQPLDTGLIAWVALVFVFFIVCLFVYFGENTVAIPENVGQIGDFVGGLTNPVLSFLALLVLLRTTRIQTLESRKTTAFMRAQQILLEEERFESTFFHLLSQLEMYCEKHFRDDDDGESYAEELSQRLCANYEIFGCLEKPEQLKAAEEHVKEVLDSTHCTMLFLRYMRVVKFITASKMDKNLRSRYASILRDTVYPDENILIASRMFFAKTSAPLIKKLKLIDVGREYFVCPEVEYYYKGTPPEPTAAEG